VLYTYVYLVPFTLLWFFFMIHLLNYFAIYPKKPTTPVRKWATIFADPSFTTFWCLFSFLIYAGFEIISTNSHIRHTQLPERNKVLMVHDSIKNGSYLTYSKYGAFTLLPTNQRKESRKRINWWRNAILNWYYRNNSVSCCTDSVEIRKCVLNFFRIQISRWQNVTFTVN
jgi:hypothetical protein